LKSERAWPWCSPWRFWRLVTILVIAFLTSMKTENTRQELQRPDESPPVGQRRWMKRSIAAIRHPTPDGLASQHICHGSRLRDVLRNSQWNAVTLYSTNNPGRAAGPRESERQLHHYRDELW